MKNLCICIFFMAICQISFSQSKTIFYKNGQNGIELIAKGPSGTIVVSTFNAKMTIKSEIAQNFYKSYCKHEVVSDSTYTIKAAGATVTGKCKIIQKSNLTSLNFYYEKIEWEDGLVEIHVNK